MENNEHKNPLEFNVVGIPGNDEIEVEDEVEPKDNRKKFSFGFKGDSDALMKQISEMYNMDISKYKDLLKKELSEMDGDDDLKGLLSQILGVDFSDDEEEDDDFDDEEPTEEKKLTFELGKISHLFQSGSFQAITYQTDPDLHLSFVETFGPGPYTSKDFSDKNLQCFSSIPVPLSKIKEFKIVESNNKYILLYGTTDDKKEQGIFVAATKDPTGKDFQLIFPEYGNTYKLLNTSGEYENDEMFADNPKNCMLYSSDRDPEYFTDAGVFKFLDLEKITTGLELLLCPETKPLVSIEDFGTLVQMRSSVDVNDTTNKLRIGILKSNNSAKANLLKRDFDIPEEQTTFNFYIRFPYQVDGIVLNYLAEYFNKVNLTETDLVKNYELKVFGRGDALYVDLDIGLLGTNFAKWFNDRGNAEL